MWKPEAGARRRSDKMETIFTMLKERAEGEEEEERGEKRAPANTFHAKFHMGVA